MGNKDPKVNQNNLSINQDSLNFFICGNNLDKIKNEVIIKNSNNKFYYKDIINELKNGIINDIKEKIENDMENNFLIILLDSLNQQKDLIIKILNIINEETPIFHPQIIFAFYKANEFKESYIEIAKNIIESNNYINICINYIHLINYNDIGVKIEEISKYFNNIGDIFLYPDILFNKSINYYNSNDKIINNKNRYFATFNIIFIGQKGAGKSTLINIFLNKQKAREGFGFNSTKKISNYLHDEYPLLLIDTPSLESHEKLYLEKYFFNINKIFENGKNKIHLALYLINSSNERNFSKEEIKLINIIIKNRIVLFFVCTKSKNMKHSKNFEEYLKVSLKKIFGSNTNLIKNIFSCQLINEKDNVYKQFGIDTLIQAITNYFDSNYFEKELIENFKNIVGINKNISFKEFDINQINNYLSKNADKIIKRYNNIFNENSKDKNEYKIDSKELEQMFYNHLSFEMNIKEDLTDKYIEIVKEVKEEIAEEDSKCSLVAIPFLNKNENKLFKNIGEKLKKIFLDLKKDDLNYFNEILNDYKMAINFLLEISKKFKDNNNI